MILVSVLTSRIRSSPQISVSVTIAPFLCDVFANYQEVCPIGRYSMGIEQEITRWDGRSAADIGAVFDRFKDDSSFVATLVDLSNEKELQKGSTWLLKHYLESVGSISAEHVEKLVKLLPQLENWEARLHVLQCIPYLRITNDDRKAMELFLRRCLTDDKKFVRAWSYNGFYELSRQFPEYRSEAERLLETAMKDEAPSVRARIRNIMKDGF